MNQVLTGLGQEGYPATVHGRGGTLASMVLPLLPGYTVLSHVSVMHAGSAVQVKVTDHRALALQKTWVEDINASSFLIPVEV